jgi:hypothetical protein
MSRNGRHHGSNSAAAKIIEQTHPVILVNDIKALLKQIPMRIFVEVSE